jgi:hypothetical protein
MGCDGNGITLRSSFKNALKREAWVARYANDCGSIPQRGNIVGGNGSILAYSDNAVVDGSDDEDDDDDGVDVLIVVGVGVALTDDTSGDGGVDDVEEVNDGGVENEKLLGRPIDEMDIDIGDGDDDDGDGDGVDVGSDDGDVYDDDEGMVVRPLAYPILYSYPIDERLLLCDDGIVDDDNVDVDEGSAPLPLIDTPNCDTYGDDDDDE